MGGGNEIEEDNESYESKIFKELVDERYFRIRERKFIYSDHQAWISLRIWCELHEYLFEYSRIGMPADVVYDCILYEIMPKPLFIIHDIWQRNPDIDPPFISFVWG
jgi:hypothetical protein